MTPARLLPEPFAAAYIGVSRSTLRKLGIKRRILGRKRLYDRIDLDAYADGLSYEDESDQENTCDEVFG